MIITNSLVAVLGLVILILGARTLIRGASALGIIAGVSPVVIGLTIVAYGTSTPELVVSVMGSYGGFDGLAIGNVIGSNVFNVLFILGLSAALVPLVVNHRLLQYDVPIILFVSCLPVVFAWNGVLSVFEGMGLVGLLIGYTVWAIRESRREVDEVKLEFQQEYTVEENKQLDLSMAKSLGLVVGGLGLLVVGSRLFTYSASSIARGLGISETVIGLTIVSSGTSLPEVGTSVMAALRGEPDIAVGNVLGSNFFNLTGVLGFSMLASWDGMTVPVALLWFDLPVLILVSVLCFPILFSEHRISRVEGLFFLLFYGGYLTILVYSEFYPADATYLKRMTLYILTGMATVSFGFYGIRSIFVEK